MRSGSKNQGKRLQKMHKRDTESTLRTEQNWIRLNEVEHGKEKQEIGCHKKVFLQPAPELLAPSGPPSGMFFFYFCEEQIPGQAKHKQSTSWTDFWRQMKTFLQNMRAAWNTKKENFISTISQFLWLKCALQYNFGKKVSSYSVNTPHTPSLLVSQQRLAIMSAPHLQRLIG